MNADRLLREVEKRLVRLDEPDRAEVLDALREELARERRRSPLEGTVERERERRTEAETLRAILEAINRQGTLEETIEEVLKQLSRLVAFDSCSLALMDLGGDFRIIATRGFDEPARFKGLRFHDPISEVLRHGRAPVSLSDVSDDERFAKIEGTEQIRSWAGIPLLVEGEVIGVLSLDRNRVEPFDEEELHRAKAVAFSAAAAIRKAQLLEKVRRYAALMERVVHVDEAVFAGRSPAHVARLILEGALKVGSYLGGLVVLTEGETGHVAAATDGLLLAEGATAPASLMVRTTRRLDRGEAAGVAALLPPHGLYLVPLATSDIHVGTLVLVDPSDETPDDRLMEAYASRAAAAYLHARRENVGGTA